jgi:hypothetical protein
MICLIVQELCANTLNNKETSSDLQITQTLQQEHASNLNSKLNSPVFKETSRLSTSLPDGGEADDSKNGSTSDVPSQSTESSDDEHVAIIHY